MSQERRKYEIADMINEYNGIVIDFKSVTSGIDIDKLTGEARDSFLRLSAKQEAYEVVIDDLMLIKSSFEANEILQAELTKEREANKKLREGLEWYADPKTWNLGVTITLGSAYPHPEPIKSDRGKRARSILEGNEPNEGGNDTE